MKVSIALLAAVLTVPLTAFSPDAVSTALVLDGTIVTMNPARDVIHDGHVLVKDGRIAAVWSGARPPAGISIAGASHAGGPHAYIYPGLINLHDHPFFGALPLWQPPASHAQPAAGRPQGTEPYANRYQWNQVPSTAPPEYRRLVDNPAQVLSAGIALDVLVDVVKFDKVRMVLGGTTTTQGIGSNAAYDNLLARNLEGLNFGRQRIFSRVAPVAAATPGEIAQLQGAMGAGLLDAFVVHLAEGVRDGDRRPGDTFSSRAEFADLKARHLLNDTTVIVHGTALEAADFADMAAAPPARFDGAGDGRGAKLVWSPLSNLLLYGKTTDVLAAVSAGVLVSLGTDWSPSGSSNLLTEMKIADLVLGEQVQAHGRAAADMDRLLVEMATINPAQSVRWDDQVGSIEAGKVADLIVVDGPRSATGDQVPRSPYRRLIDATERDMQLVLVGGRPVAGDVEVMQALLGDDKETLASDAGCFAKAVDVTDDTLPGGTATLAQIAGRLTEGLAALGGDHPPAGGGPSSPLANTWSYLKAHFSGTSALPDIVFNFGLAQNFPSTPAGLVNIERMMPPPLFTVDDDWWFATLEARRDPVTHLTVSAAAPYGPYPSNANHLAESGNLLASEHLRERWYSARQCRAR